MLFLLDFIIYREYNAFHDFYVGRLLKKMNEVSYSDQLISSLTCREKYGERNGRDTMTKKLFIHTYHIHGGLLLLGP